MKAIINLKKSSVCSYKNFNGHTFEVVEVSESYISLKGANTEYPNNQVDFSHKEVIIVDIAYEIGKIKSDIIKWKLTPTMSKTEEKINTLKRKLSALLKYVDTNKIKGFQNAEI